jgi:threonine dehydratase
MRDLVRSGQVTTLSITLPDKPGQLAIISKICAANGANVLQVEHSRFTIDLSASLAKLNITVETQNSDHLNKIVKEIERNGLPVEIEGLV